MFSSECHLLTPFTTSAGIPPRHVQCRAMLAEEKADLSKFGAASRQRVASEVGCTITQVRRYLLWVVSAFFAMHCCPTRP